MREREKKKTVSEGDRLWNQDLCGNKVDPRIFWCWEAEGSNTKERQRVGPCGGGGVQEEPMEAGFSDGRGTGCERRDYAWTIRQTGEGEKRLEREE